MQATYTIIVPLFNEEEVVQECYQRLVNTLVPLNEPFEILFVNDGSKDRTAEIVHQICQKDSCVKLIEFARNFGHQIAISAGFDHANGKAVIVIDADLQDPPEAMIPMMERWKQGYDVVYGKRIHRKGETWFKKITAALFYRFLNRMTNIQIPVDVGDFRLIDRKVCLYLRRLPEKHRYVRGLISWLGFKQTYVEYIREKRFAGETKYPLRKMIKLAFDAITSFSIKPLRLATFMGAFFSLGGVIYLAIVFWQTLVQQSTVPGWASLIAINLIFSGVTLLILGIIGEYVGRIYEEVKGRPLYVICNTVGIHESTTITKDHTSIE